MRFADFATVGDALDYAALGEGCLNFHSGRSELLERLSYRDLREQALILARRMVRAGLRKGNRLALIAETSADFVRVFCAAQYAGIVPVPLPLPAGFGSRDSYLTQIRLQIESSGAAALVSSELGGLPAEAARGLPMKFLGNAKSLSALPEGGIDLPTVGAGDLCYLQFSSGSTRSPLGVAVTQRALMSNASAISHRGLQAKTGDRCVSWLPFYHDMGLVGFFLTPLASQLSVDYLATRDFARRPLLWLSLISRNRGTLSYSPSFGYELCAQWAATAPPDNLDLSAWRVAGVGGDIIRPQVLRQFASAFAGNGFERGSFVASYGLAEGTLAVSIAPLGRGIETDRVELDRLEQDRVAVPAQDGPEAVRTRDFALCGNPLPGIAVEIRGEDGKALPDRGVGRVFVRGPSIMAGYVNGYAETARVLAPDGWLDTGDLGYRINEALVIVGREKDLIIVNGRNIWPQDLEWAAERTPGLRAGDVAAFSVDDDVSDGECVVLLVQCRASDRDTRAALAKAVAGAVVAASGVDCEIVLVPPQSLPYTSSGKLSRSRAKRKFLKGEYGSANAEGARRLGGPSRIG